jgi:hypothetical protein
LLRDDAIEGVHDLDAALRGGIGDFPEQRAGGEVLLHRVVGHRL